MDKGRSAKPLKSAVLDASILVKIVLPEKNEENVREALLLFERFANQKLTITLPSFWNYEVGNTLVRKLSTGLFEEKFAFLLSQPFEIYSFSKTENVTIGKFAKLHYVSFYDASYHLLAYFTDSLFITADKKYFGQFKKDKHIILLGSLKTRSS
ncbi:type II toxin-antitoxin system VapC family toxin [Candidatus Curtissbacteria bacterium]|nr:type II toxin-antitoxin system VapC family toxin [Candidatus Curtissbacteria bacterium]